MARYTDESLDRLRAAVDIVELVSAKTDLRRVGSRWTGLCPLHEERTPSFSVDPDKGVYYCFGCQAGGDAIGFMRETEGLDFREAVELLAERYDVELKLDDEDPRAEQRRRRRERLLALLDRVSRFYATYLWEAEEARKARDYLAGRGLSEEILREFRVGYAPSAWDRVIVAAQRDGYSPEELVAAGVAVHGRSGGLYDRFRGRIMFPLADFRGHVRGFGARVLGEGRGPKYLNTSENDLFHKGRQLFGIDIARAHAAKSGRIVVVEGYTDVLALHQAGVREAVAIMGTALTQEQLTELERAATLVVLALDADRSGQEAMARAAKAAKKVELKVVEMPEGSDPADLIAAEGAEAFEARLRRAIEVELFQLRRVVADANLDSPTGKDHALEEVRKLIAGTPERSALRDALVRDAADRLDVPDSYVTPGREGGASIRARPQEARPGVLSRTPERAFMSRCLVSGEVGRAFLERLTEDHLPSQLDMRAYRHLREHFDDPLVGLGEEDPQLGRLIADVVNWSSTPATRDELRFDLAQLELRRIDRELRRAAERGDLEAQLALARALQAARQELESVSGQTA